MKALRELAVGTRRDLVLAVLFALGQAALLLPVALLVRDVFDRDVATGDEGAIVWHGTLVALCYLGSSALMAAGRTYAARTVRVALGATRRRLVAQLETLPLSWHDRQRDGALHAIVVQDCERVDRMAGALVSVVLPSVVTLAGLAVVALILNPLLFCAAAVFVALMFVGGRVFSRAHAARVCEWHRTFVEFSEHTMVLLASLATIRAAGASRRDRERFEAEVDRFVAAGYRQSVSGSRYQAVQSALAGLAGVAVLVLGGILVGRGVLSLGGLIAFYAVIALMLRQVSGALSVAPTVIDGASALTRVRDLAAEREPHAYAGTDRLAFEGGISLAGVSFAYGDEPRLCDVSLAIEPGERVCVVGANGSGKTTLMALMLGLYRPQQGIVRADGVPLEFVDLDDLRDQAGVVLQDASLFAGTVRENLRLGRPDATNAELADALAVAEADFASLDVVLGDGGAGLSGGQRQRLAIARAVLGRPPLILLDEPTAHLTEAMASSVLDSLFSLPWRPTVVVITHVADLAAQADRVVQLDAGRVIQPIGAPQHVS